MEAKTEVRVVVRAILRNPHWTLAVLSEQIATDRSAVLGRVTIADLLADTKSDATSVLELLGEAQAPLSAALMRERLGVSRWKISEWLRQLRERGLVERIGKTCGARYQLKARAD